MAALAFWAFTAGRVWLNGLLKALSIVIVLYLVRKDENSAYKIGWIVLIGLLPLLGGRCICLWQQGPGQGAPHPDAEGGAGPHGDLAPRPDRPTRWTAWRKT